jgi:tetratricopeptide (TPR) repeat protein
LGQVNIQFFASRKMTLDGNHLALSSVFLINNIVLGLQMQRTTRNYLFTAAAAVLLLAAAAYWQSGTTETTSQHVAMAKGNGKPVASVASMVDDLAARLQADPDDAKGWLLLAKSYKHLGRIDEAQRAYKQAAMLGEYDEGLAALSGAAASSESAARRIVGEVSLSESASKVVLPTDTVFIFARAPDGPQVPVAVVQRSAADLPLQFSLSDSQAMSPETRLSKFDSVIVTAKVSRTGEASSELQSLQARSEIISVADHRRLNLIIE